MFIIRKIEQVILFWIVNLVRLYQIFISPVKGKTCRFYPSCSEYCLMSIKKNGIIGLIQTIIRILKCGPWSKGGFDYPKKINLNIYHK